MADNQYQGATGGADNQGLVVVGQNLVAAVNNLNQTVKATFPGFVPFPANSTAAGAAGSLAFTGSATSTAYLAVCISPNQWARVVLTTSGW